MTAGHDGIDRVHRASPDGVVQAVPIPGDAEAQGRQRRSTGDEDLQNFGARGVSLDVAPARSPRWAPWVMASGFAAGVLGASFLTVWRYTADYLQADGVMQALMSVQHVDPFFWGQDRFFSCLLYTSDAADE